MGTISETSCAKKPSTILLSESNSAVKLNLHGFKFFNLVVAVHE